MNQGVNLFTFSIKTYLVLLIERLIDSDGPMYQKISNLAEPNSQYFECDGSKTSV